MSKEITKLVIAVLVVLAAALFPEQSQWTIPAVGLVVGYYFGHGKETLKILRKK